METNVSGIQITHRKLSDLLHEFKSKGVIRIPPFQREYVWEQQKVAVLFDSIYHQFPIGSFFFWAVPEEYRNLVKELPELKLPPLPPNEKIKLVLDGQQRLTSLYCAAFGIQTSRKDGGKVRDYRKICFNLDTGEFAVAPRGENKETTVSVARFFDKNLEYEVYDALTPERRRAFQQCSKLLDGYPISVVEVTDVDLEDAIKIFERINQGGKKLTLFDLVVASTWSADFDLRDEIEKLNKSFEKSGFGAVDEDVVTQALALVIRGQCTHAFQLQMTSGEIRACWEEVSDGLKLAVDHLSKNLGVKIYDFMPYPIMISLLGYLFTKLDGRSLSPTQIEVVKTWFWKASFAQRYGSSTLTTAGQDKTDILDPLIKGETPEIEYPLTISIKDITAIRMHRKSAVKNAVLCLLALAEPRHFNNGSIVTLDRTLCSDYNHPEKHHIFPRAFLEREGANNSEVNALPNFAFIPGELNREITDKEPKAYMAEYRKANRAFDAAMKSHLIPAGDDSGIWGNDYEKFLKQRAELIYERVKDAVAA
ncbi:MAG: hypothetical protein A2756_04985 [Candidatus Ryanbacteria bacterium RIFCSPHIGHO2_01_FULL_48_27]|uniref:GmrSD restriction endonucleases N-terminal domain-containing protein n=1 Tax=Candidatus Ryanbacteria bacterium RIFCSPHIGHO2_01_FULL_48_27 TaxID=1802115 RepID=A0A1G2G3E6_9BACT|nr:MAG: hypothetical protein A2756_04985 [Candidatus Ryanbacteria bacterium RIFCSPHIGHO2_01_FULL_48_27]